MDTQWVREQVSHAPAVMMAVAVHPDRSLQLTVLEASQLILIVWPG